MKKSQKWTPLLSQLINQFEAKHGKKPTEIVVHPVALAALAVKGSLAPKWNGIPVSCAEVAPTRKNSNRLGITVVRGALRGFDL